MDDETKRPEDDLNQPSPSRETQSAPQEEPQEKKDSVKSDLYFWVQTLSVSLILLVIVFTFIGRLTRVDGTSMVPTLHHNDLMLVQSIGYEPKPGDVVVLRKAQFMEAQVVKRVIAVGGQHVQVDYNTHLVYVDGVPLNEPYINEIMEDPRHADLSVLDVTVPDGSIYVLGDNRNNSSDSRHVRLGTVDTRYVLGRVVCVLFPFSDFGLVE